MLPASGETTREQDGEQQHDHQHQIQHQHQLQAKEKLMLFMEIEQATAKPKDKERCKRRTCESEREREQEHEQEQEESSQEEEDTETETEAENAVRSLPKDRGNSSHGNAGKGNSKNGHIHSSSSNTNSSSNRCSGGGFHSANATSNVNVSSGSGSANAVANANSNSSSSNTPNPNANGTGSSSSNANATPNASSSSSRKRKTRSTKKDDKAAFKQSPFEKLNTLKLLLDGGHLTKEEYNERKNQIINEMTGTSADRVTNLTPSRTLQPIMKTVVPHNPPDFSRILKERAEKLSFDVDTLEWHSAPTIVKIDLVPFATGQLRNAYFLQDLGEKEEEAKPQLLVAKFSIRHAEPSSYLSDVEMQAVCAHYAALYNDHEPPLRVQYARSWLLKLRDRGDLVCSVEEYLPGAYVKYSNNNGFVGKETSTTEERERNTPQAFSHFTFVASDYRLMVVDIQGVNDSYTDPQIHTADGKGFGAGNLGTYGMEKFLESHRCNEVCRWLGLKSINKQYKPGGTAAPLYRMPHGVIKKSTNRITEERNTFSRSITVSEVLGSETCDTLTEESTLLKMNTLSMDEQPTMMDTVKRMVCCCFVGSS